MGCNCILIVLLVNLICMYILTFSDNMCVRSYYFTTSTLDQYGRAEVEKGVGLWSSRLSTSRADLMLTTRGANKWRLARQSIDSATHDSRPVWVSYLPARGHSRPHELLLTWVCDLVQPSSSGRAVLTASSGGSSAQLFTANDNKKKSSTGDGANEPNRILKSAWWERVNRDGSDGAVCVTQVRVLLCCLVLTAVRGWTGSQLNIFARC